MNMYIVKRTVHKYYEVQAKSAQLAAKKSLAGKEPILSFVTCQRTVKIPPEKDILKMLEKTLNF